MGGKPRVVAAFPGNCDSPKAISEYIAGLSTEALRSHLKGTSEKRDGSATAKAHLRRTAEPEEQPLKPIVGAGRLWVFRFPGGGFSLTHSLVLSKA